MSLDGERWLHERIDELDAVATARRLSGHRLLIGYVSVMSEWTNTRMWIGNSAIAVVKPSTADSIVDSCKLLQVIADSDRDLVDGPIARSSQEWIGCRGAVLEREAFTEPRNDSAKQNAAFGGLFTSTASQSGCGMWRMYLEDGSEGCLHPHPWRVYRIESQRSRVAEVRSAVDWYRLVSRFGYLRTDGVIPDWEKMSVEYDAVHLTLRAVTALQGFGLCGERGTIAPSFWDVETTLWLRWAFDKVEQVAVLA